MGKVFFIKFLGRTSKDCMNIKHVNGLFFSVLLRFTKPLGSAPELGIVLIGQFMTLIS